jgi:hypothetical protein
MVKSVSGRRFLSNDRFCKEKAAFIVKKIGIFAFKGKLPYGNWYFMR